MKPLRVWLAGLLVGVFAIQSFAANVLFYVGATGQTLYVRVNESGTYVARALTEGTSGGEGTYYATEAQLVTAGVDTASTGNGFPFTVRVGSPSTSATDPIVAFGDLPWDGDSEVSLADQVADEVGGGTPISPFLASKGHSWKFDSPTQITSPTLIQEVTGFDDLLLEVDFSGVLNNNASISSITSVTIADVAMATEPTVVSSAKRADNKAVNIITDGASVTAGTYTYSVKIVTTDSQTITRKGRLVVQ